VKQAALKSSERWALGSLCLAILLAALGTSIANVALPTLARAFQAPFQAVQWVVLAYLLAITSLIVGVGWLGDFLGRRRLLLAGMLLFTVASLLCALSPSLWLLIAARALQGLGAAIMMALTIAFVSEIVPKAKAGSAIGLLGTMSAIGTALGPSLGGILIAEGGWRAIFLVSVPVGGLTLLLAYCTIPATPRQPQAGKFDALGILTLALTLVAYALAMTLGRGHFEVWNGVLLLAACGGFWLFLRIEARAVSPILPQSLLRDPARCAGFIANGLVSTVMMATLIVGPFYLSQALGLSETGVGAVLTLGPLLSAVTGVPAGRLVDRLGAAAATRIGLGLMLVGAVALALLPVPFGVIGYSAAIVLLTPGYQLFQAANTMRIMAEVPADQRGVTSGILTLSRNLGLITGASVMGATFAFTAQTFGQSVSLPEAVTLGMQVTFLLAAGLIVAALRLHLAPFRRAQSPGPQP
jgi:MFS family permease